MLNASLKELSNQLTEKKISSVELTSLFLQRIKKFNPDYNAFITTNEEISLAQAAVADKMLAAGKAEALTGIPIAQKDIFVPKVG